MLDHWLVVTDLDGTLLNHHDYRVESALPMLAQLEQQHIPVIFNSSKTFTELARLARELDNRHPFIMENGAAIAIPTGYFETEAMSATGLEMEPADDYSLLVLGVSREKIDRFLEQHPPPAINLCTCSLEEAMDITGLDESGARGAQARRFTVPLLFNNMEDETEFVELAHAAGLHTQRGGRFLHVQGPGDKGEAMLKLKQLYQHAADHDYGTIVLGDSPNDTDMLLQADRAVIVHSTSNHHFRLAHPSLIRTHYPAPEGWVEGILAVLGTHKVNLETPHG